MCHIHRKPRCPNGKARLPDRLLAFWQEFGWGAFSGGPF
ncbi:GAD-like domain-containing protein [Ponticoccus sp. (in: a-proteobacteria)]